MLYFRKMKERSAKIFYKEWVMRSIKGMVSLKKAYIESTWPKLDHTQWLELKQWERNRFQRNKMRLRLSDIEEFLTPFKLVRITTDQIMKMGIFNCLS